MSIISKYMALWFLAFNVSVSICIIASASNVDLPFVQNLSQGVYVVCELEDVDLAISSEGQIIGHGNAFDLALFLKSTKRHSDTNSLSLSIDRSAPMQRVVFYFKEFANYGMGELRLRVDMNGIQKCIPYYYPIADNYKKSPWMKSVLDREPTTPWKVVRINSSMHSEQLDSMLSHEEGANTVVVIIDYSSTDAFQDFIKLMAFALSKGAAGVQIGEFIGK